MRANVLLKPGTIEMQHLPIPDPEPGGVVVRVMTALTCGTDLKAFLRGHPKFPTPTLFGHEFAGVIAKVGKGVTRFKEGDVVMSTHSAPCGACYYCRRGQENLCDTIMSTMVLGAYAEYIHIPERIVRQNMYPKPESLSYREAALMEPLACVVHGLEEVPIREDDTVSSSAMEPLLCCTLPRSRHVVLKTSSWPGAALTDKRQLALLGLLKQWTSFQRPCQPRFAI
jgi:L-iditol 2-dehydrogenase